MAYSAEQVLQILIHVNHIAQEEEGYSLLNLEDSEQSWDGMCHTVDEVVAHILKKNRIIINSVDELVTANALEEKPSEPLE